MNVRSTLKLRGNESVSDDGRVSNLTRQLEWFGLTPNFGCVKIAFKLSCSGDLFRKRVHQYDVVDILKKWPRIENTETISLKWHIDSNRFSRVDINALGISE